MKSIFADTFYWTALLNPKDEYHAIVKNYSRQLEFAILVTSDEVITEFLNFFSNYHPLMRQGAVQRAKEILNNDSIQVIPSNRDRFLAGIELYQQRPDKGYSLTDCLSMLIMREREIQEILTHDKHFTQEGFTILFP
jgi:predicted nucleic acid-binding protein